MILYLFPPLSYDALVVSNHAIDKKWVPENSGKSFSLKTTHKNGKICG